VQHLDLSKCNLSQDFSHSLAEVIHKVQHLETLLLSGNKLTVGTVKGIYAVLSFNKCVSIIKMDKNADIKESDLKELNTALTGNRRRTLMNSITMYLLGYGFSGKTTLRRTLKNKFRKVPPNERPEKLGDASQTVMMEVEKKISLGNYQAQIIDFGGQEYYHYAIHLFIRPARSIFLVLADPWETGHQEQLFYWLRLLTIKSQDLEVPEAMIVFSKRDVISLSVEALVRVEEATSKNPNTKAAKEKEEKEKAAKTKEEELHDLVVFVTEKFQDKVHINGWVWVNCKALGEQSQVTLDTLDRTVKAALDNGPIGIPDPAIPQKILDKATDVFMERKYLEGIVSNITITTFLKEVRIGEDASPWVAALIKSQDFFSVTVGSEEYICPNLQRLGQEVLHVLQEVVKGKQVTRSELVNKIFSNSKLSSEPWLPKLPEILEALKLAFSLDKETYFVPCLISDKQEGAINERWDNITDDKTITVDEGRRFHISDDCQGFHPAFVPQCCCVLFEHDKEKLFDLVRNEGTEIKSKPIIWQGGLVCQARDRDTGDICHVAIYLHGAFVPDNSKIQAEEKRRHGEPEYLRALDVLVRGRSQAFVTKVLKMIVGAVTETRKSSWKSLSWSLFALFPTIVRQYFEMEEKYHVPLLPFPEGDEFASWPDLRNKILENPYSKKYGRTSYLHALCLEGGGNTPAKIQELIESGVYETTQRTRQGLTPLMFAIFSRDIDVVKMLLATSRDLAVHRRWRGRTADKLAELYGNPRISPLLLNYNPETTPNELRVDLKLPPLVDKSLRLELLFGEEKKTKKDFHLASMRDLRSLIADVLGITGDIQLFEPSEPRYTRQITTMNYFRQTTGTDITVDVKEAGLPFWDLTPNKEEAGWELETYSLRRELTVDDTTPAGKKLLEIYSVLKISPETVDKAYAVFNKPRLVDFNNAIGKIAGHHRDNPTLSNKKDWEKLPDADQRHMVRDHLFDFANEFEWYSPDRVSVPIFLLFYFGFSPIDRVCVL